MENKVKIPVIHTVFTIVAIVAAMVLFVLRATTVAGSTGFVGVLVTFFLAALCALAYTCLGSKKEDFLFFRGCCIAYALYKLAIIMNTSSSEAVAALALNALCLIFITVLGTAQNLGKKYSLLFAFLNLAATVAGLIINLVNGWEILGVLGGSVFAFAFLLMVFSKYINKAQRGH